MLHVMCSCEFSLHSLRVKAELTSRSHDRQTPTLNAKPVVRGIIEACTRGIQVKLYLDLGFNDQGESVPFQGGTNEEVVFYLFKTLSQEAVKNLHVYWYVGKDQCIPLNAVHKTRNCHGTFISLSFPRLS